MISNCKSFVAVARPRIYLQHAFRIQVGVRNIEAVAGPIAEGTEIEDIGRTKSETGICNELPGVRRIEDPADVATGVRDTDGCRFRYRCLGQ